ncbi:hypothetical protein FACS1894200_00970 [Spirochaetia bacterium]|nr:hypothetical protein FACS1894200_00970 [Spirochaetia bacterium]
MKKLILAGLLIALSSVAVFADTITLKNGIEPLKNGTMPGMFFKVYISPSGSDDWGDDLLGNAVVGPGKSMTFDIAVNLNSTTIDIAVIDHFENEYIIYDRKVRNGATVTITLADLSEGD